MLDKIKTTGELLAYAEKIGLEVPENVQGNFNRIKSFIKVATGVVDESPAEDPKDTKRVNIIIQTSEKDSQPVFVGINGKGYSIKRGERVSVPVGIVDILNNAIQKLPEKDRNGRIIGWKESQLYPFSVVE